jgi:serine/threonine-protein kinase PknG
VATDCLASKERLAQPVGDRHRPALDAAAALSEVSPHSRHYDAARIAALRVRAARLPAGTDGGTGGGEDEGGDEAALPDARSLAEVPGRLAALLDDRALSSTERDSLEAELRCRALDWAGGRGGWPVSADDATARDLKHPPFSDDGTPPTEESLRVLLAESFERLARVPETAPADREFLVDCANAAHPRSWFVRRRSGRAR